MARPAMAATPAVDAINRRILDTGTAVTSGRRLCGLLHHTVAGGARITPDAEAEPCPTGPACRRREASSLGGRRFVGWFQLVAGPYGGRLNNAEMGSAA